MKALLDKQQFGAWARVTGHSCGIGREFARQTAAAGINVVLVARRETTLIEVERSIAKDFLETRRAYEGSGYRPCRLECWHAKPGRVPEARSTAARGDLATQHHVAFRHRPLLRPEARRAEAGRLDPRGGNGGGKRRSLSGE